METPYHTASRVIDDSASRQNVPATQLRPLPGYSTVKRSDSIIPATPFQPQTSTAFGTTSQTTQPTRTAAKPYKNRERLYYETESKASQAGKVGDKDNKSNPLVPRLAEDAPPSLSLHDVGTLTPDRRFAKSNDALSEVVLPSGESPSKKLLREEQAMAEVVQELSAPSEGNWITVFGFSGSQSANAVLSYFKKLGTVEQYEICQGNWMHVKYATRWAAQKALAKNGTILPEAGSFMIGVVPTQKAISQVNTASESFMSPLKKERLQPAMPENGKAVRNQDIFLRKGAFTPQVNRSNVVVIEQAKETAPSAAPAESNVLTKALGVIFGW